VTAAAGQELASLSIEPAEIRLEGSNDHARLVVLARFANGTTAEVTAGAEIAIEGAIAEHDGGVLFPRKDGKSTLTASWKGREASAPISVTNAGIAPEVSFRGDVIPHLTKMGCNAGGCHGAAVGKGGFRLSLFGDNPGADHMRLTRELRGRRVAPDAPEKSLMLTKPTTQVTHKGGRIFEQGSPTWEVINEWISNGAADDRAGAPKIVGLRVMPTQAVLDGKGLSQRLIVMATYADGTDRDVTDLALLSSSNTTSATVDDHGVVTSGARGEAYVMARFGPFAEVAQVLVLDPDPTFTWPASIKSNNYVDERIHEKLRQLRVLPADVCDDATFVRRVYLDILSVVPSSQETRAFLADKSPDKRAKLVDTLLARPEFADVWTLYWSEVLRIESQQLERKGMHKYTEYLRDSFKNDVPFDRIVRELLSAEGAAFSVPQANFYLVEQNPRAIAENVAQVFLGIRVQCAQCHNHPFERWTQDDYYGFAAFFSRVARKRSEDPRELIVLERGSGDMRHPVGNAIVPPRYLAGDAAVLKKGQNRRQALAAWMTSKENSWFATNLANRVFERFMGRGVVDPTDDVRVSNPPSHPKLYEALGSKLVEYDFNIKQLIRDICASRSYQLAARTDEIPASAFAGAPVRRLTAEQLLDAIAKVTQVPVKYRGLPEGARATEVTDGNPRSRFLDIFGRSRRGSACTCDRRDEPTLTQALHLINGATVGGRLLEPRGRLARLIKAKTPPDKILEDLWLAAYSRSPSASERTRWLQEAKEAKNSDMFYADLMWALLNSKEFLFNH